jgi:hypothetical protein
LTDVVPARSLENAVKFKPTEVAPDIYAQHVRAMSWRVLMTICLKIPAMVVLVRSQARQINQRGHTIVRCQRNQLRRRAYYEVFTGIDWVRIFLNAIQCLIVSCIVVAAVLFFGYLQFRNLRQASKLNLWVYGDYLRPERAVGLGADFRAVWWWRNSVLITLNPWRWVLPYSKAFTRAQAFDYKN